MNTHISSAYDRDLDAIQTLVIKMAGLVEEAIMSAAKSLEMRDTDLADRVRAGDKVIDALELQINEEAARVIALRAPVSKDLRAILTVLRIAASLERIGDCAKNMAKRTGTLVDMPVIAGSDAALRRMARVCKRCSKTFSTLTCGATWPWPKTCGSATMKSTRCITRFSANS